jgi:hypothetical protein
MRPATSERMHVPWHKRVETGLESRDTLFSAFSAAYPLAKRCWYYMNNGSCSGLQACWKRAEKLRSIVETDTATVEQTLFELTGIIE